MALTQPSQVCRDEAVPWSSRMVGVSSGVAPMGGSRLGAGAAVEPVAIEGVPGLAVGAAALVPVAAVGVPAVSDATGVSSSGLLPWPSSRQ